MAHIVCLYGEGRPPRLDLEYPIYGAHELADEGAFTSVVVLTASFPSGFRRGRDLNPRGEASRNAMKLITDLCRPAKP